jgi:glycyl-tRNA synthetase beta chain
LNGRCRWCARSKSAFLDVPQEALITTMQDNQKYFCLLDADGKLLPRFITVANIESKDPQQIIAGNEKVVRPRLTDAEFFFKQDKKQKLEDFNLRLQNVVFQEKLGSVYDKAERVSKLAAFIARASAATPPGGPRRPAVQVRPGHRNGRRVPGDARCRRLLLRPQRWRAGRVALALNEQYMPRGAGAELPATLTGAAVAIADKLDTLVGIFGIGMLPTGSKDPYALRRAAGRAAHPDRETTRPRPERRRGFAVTVRCQGQGCRPGRAVLEFIFDRLRARYEDEGVDVATYLSVRALKPGSALDFDQRVQAVQAFRKLPEAGPWPR